MKLLSFKTKILLLATVPLAVISVMLTALAFYQISELGKNNIASFEETINDLRRDELKNYTDLAMSAIDHIYDQEYYSFDEQQEAKERAKEVFRDLSYGNDGYFFVYDYEAVTIVDSKTPSLEGRNLRNMADDNGVPFIQELIANARSGGGYTDYLWDKPSLERKVDKMSYSQALENWGWVVGTGLYVDDLDGSVKALNEQVDSNISNTVMLIGGLALGGTLLVGIFVARFTVSESKLADNKSQQLSRKNVEVQEAERSRVSRQLQSGINQALVASRAKLQKVANAKTLDDPATRKEFVAAVSILNKTIKEVYRISGELRPSALDQMGLCSALEVLIAEVRANSGIDVEFKSIDMEARLSSEIETAVYRIVQEALKNIQLHSKATDVSVRIRHTSKLLTLNVQDNGIGFDPKAAMKRANKTGLGLSDMCVRAESLGGTFSVFASKRSGTMIKVEIPV